MMDNFFTWEMLATFAGCMAGTMVMTEFTKKIIKTLPAQFISFVYAMVILVVGQLVAKTFTWNDILLDLVNAAMISLSANGGFDAVKGLFGSKEKTTNAGDLILDGKNSYISFNSDPEGLKDGEAVKITVKRTDVE